MGVSIKLVERMKRELDPKAPWKFKSLARDRRDDPMGPAGKVVLVAQTPTKQQIRDAFEELLAPVNLMAYYMENNFAVMQRHTMLIAAWEKQDVKAAKGLVKQLWEAYVKVMKTGEWKPGKWGKHEPK